MYCMERQKSSAAAGLVNQDPTLETTPVDDGEGFASVREELLPFFRQRLPSLEVAENLLQETLFRVFRYRHGYRAGGPWMAWVRAIARNILRDHLKAANDRSERECLQSDVRSPSLSPGPEVLAERNATAELIANAVMELPEKYRVSFYLKHYKGMTYKAIGETLGCSEGTVKSRVNKAAFLLRGRLIRENLL